MSQGDESIFRGLPAKEDHIEDAPIETPWFRSRLLIGTAASALVLGVAAAIAIPLALSNQPQAQTPAPELSLSPEEVAAAEEAIASGGGAIPGHIVSGELCSAIDAYMAAGSDDEAILETTPELLAALNGLAAVESPNQKVFQDYAAMMNDPAGLSDLDAKQSLVTEFSDAVQVDVTTCL